jgi:hypothetical protein
MFRPRSLRPPAHFLWPRSLRPLGMWVLIFSSLLFSSAFFLCLLSRTRRRASLAFRVVVVVPAL